MTYMIFKDIPMNANIMSDWFRLIINPPGQTRKIARSFQFWWYGTSPMPDGLISVEGSICREARSVIMTIPVISEDNRSDAQIFPISPIIEEFRISYTCNSITAGILNAIVFYDDIY